MTSSATTGPETHAGIEFRGSEPSRQARIASSLIRTVVKRWPRGNPAVTLRLARALFGAPGIFSRLYTRNVQIAATNESGVRGEWLIPRNLASDNKVLLYLHGGGYVVCSPQSHRAITATLAVMLGWRVFVPDYRLAPKHPFPAAVDDAAAAYEWLLGKDCAPQDIALAGDSAGGGLVICTLLRLRQNQRPLPARAVCFSPWVDLTGACNYRNAQSCAMFRSGDIKAFAPVYLGTANAENPEASPVFGDLSGLPPLLIQVSSTELLFDDALRLHEKARSAGVQSTLSVYPGLPHVWQIFPGALPEAKLALQEAADFIRAGEKLVSAEPPASGSVGQG
jgi:epsilon-lactone hydrolase